MSERLLPSSYLDYSHTEEDRGGDDIGSVADEGNNSRIVSDPAGEIILSGIIVPEPSIASAGPAEGEAVPEPSSTEPETDDTIVASELDRLDIRRSNFNGCCGFGRKKFEASPALELVLPPCAGWEGPPRPIRFSRCAGKIRD